MPTEPQLLSQAIALHQSGQLPEAAAIYQQILAANPRHADALRLLGIIAHRFHRHDVSEQLLRQAIAVNDKIAEYHNDLALVLQSLNRLDEATRECRTALRLNSGLAEAHYNLANIYKAQHQPADAIVEYREALRLRPSYPEAANNLGNILMAEGHTLDALANYELAARLQPNNLDARANLAAALHAAGRVAEALTHFRTLLPLRPNDADLLYRYANALQAAGEHAQAIQYFRQALLLEPKHAACHNNLGVALQSLSRYSEAATEFRLALACASDFPEAHNNLGNALKQLDELDAAIDEFRAALALRSNYAEAWSNLGSALKDQALIEESVNAFRNAVAAKPDDPQLANNLLYTLHFDPRTTPQSLAEELAVRSTAFRRPPSPHSSPLKTPDSPRPLRIGWVSPDFRRHPIGRFLLPIFAAHDKTNFPFHCYSDAPQADELTAQLRTHAQAWHDTAKLSDQQLAAQIQRDHIDILIDLTMHMQGSRLATFALKPAPIQITYLAYASSTGIPEIDYRLTDAHLETPELTQTFVEKPLLLNSYWCYAPDPAAPDVNPLPAASTGTITFGNLNNFCKASAPALETWIKILQQLPDSQLLLHAPRGLARDRLAHLLLARKVDPARVRFTPMLPFAQYMQTYHQIDIALDPFPYTGGTTSCDALHMGVPLVTLAGRLGVSRSGVSLLSQLNLQDLIATSGDDYIAKAIALASDLPRLSHLRATLRKTLLDSPLTNAQRFAANLQSLFQSCSESRL